MIKNAPNKNELGKLGEKYACELLKKQGYKIIDRNFHSKFGELDIIAIHKDTLVFVEVKTRKGRKFGIPEESVNFFKLQKIRNVASYYNLINKNLPIKQRIDVVSLEIKNKNIIRAKIINAV